MQLRFAEDDESAFYAARAQLLERFAGVYPDDEDCGFDVELALDWKWGYSDGDLGTWSIADIDEFLLEWCPRKISMAPEEAASLPRSLSAFLTFLDGEHLLSARSSQLHRMLVHLAGMGDGVIAAMQDRSRFGMAKSLLAGMAELGPLPDNPDRAALQETMDRFNALPFEVRGEILGLTDPFRSPWEDLVGGVTLQPAPLIPAPALAELAKVPAIVEQIRLIRDFLADGRKLTAKGNLTVAEAKALAAVLDDPALTEHAKYGFSIRSADALPTTQFMLRWARAAGAVRVAKGRMLATSSWAKLDPVAALGRAVSALLEKGPLTLRTADRQWAPHALIQVIDEGAVHLLVALWAISGPLDFEELFSVVMEACEVQLSFSPHLTPESRQRQIRHEVDALFDVLALAGIVMRSGAQSVEDDHDIVWRTGGTLELTLLGRAVLGPTLTDHGYTVPTAGELADGPLSALFERIGAWSADRTRTEFDHWVERHSADEAIEQMSALLARYTDPQWPIAALDLAGRLRAPADERAARRFLDTPASGHAISWLADHGHHDVPIDPEAMLRAGLELMSVHATGDNDLEFLDLIAAIDDIEAFIDGAWRIPTPESALVLEGIGRVHPDKGIAKAARKAALRQRSYAANIGR
jgi:hypothetical protein